MVIVRRVAVIIHIPVQLVQQALQMADLLSDLLLPLHQQPAEATHVVGVQSVPDILQCEAKALKVLTRSI